MREAPAFELTLRLSAAERALLALLAAVVATALAAWVWSHVDTAAGPAGRGAWPWSTLLPIAAGLGAWIGWSAAPRAVRVLRWQQGRWTWTDAGVEHDGVVQVKLDLGSWLLLALRSQHGTTCWVTTGRRRAGAVWHPLRATLFAPGRSAIEPNPGESAPR